MTAIRIATRGSALALAQANLTLAQCQAAFPGEAFEIAIIKTTGDKLQTASLASANLPKGLFTKELETALINGEADIAVHSLKDLPTELPAGLKLGAVSKRADVRDVLIIRRGPALNSQLSTLNFLSPGATVATSSTRRRAQLLDLRPDLNIVPIRGNVGTRLRKLAEQSELDAIVLAAAGLERLHFRNGDSAEISGADVPPGLHATAIPVEQMLPCVGQAALGIEIRENDSRIGRICAALNDASTFACVTAERAFLRGMGGGCQLAVGAYGEIMGEQLRLRAISFLGAKPIRGERTDLISEATTIGAQLARELSG
ncbi:MAG TPA: hydroxymethylbilane synthase [Verrucomicrobiae bacterium]|jgi:hydroxymethylbilane synthase